MPRRDASDRHRLRPRARRPGRLRGRDRRAGEPEQQLQGGERTNGPNFNVRKVNKDDAIFAIRNGGFSGAIMPANVVTGQDAEAVADFLDKYSGKSD
jgi:hypothetical protein